MKTSGQDPFSRRKLLKSLVRWGPIVGISHWFLVACGGSGNSDPVAPTSGGNCLANGASVAIGTNHGHGAPTISASDVNTGTQNTYTLTIGSSGHSHAVTVTAAHFTSLQANTGVSVSTDSDITGHTHVISVSCA